MGISQPTTAERGVSRGRLLTAALWCIGIGLLANAAAMVYTARAERGYPTELTVVGQAQAQVPAMPGAGGPPNAMLGARGIYMAPAQLSPTTFGMYLLDLDSSTVCVYRVEANSRFRLIAARSFRHDRFVEDFNNEKPTPKEIQEWVEKQKQRNELKAETDRPTAPETAPDKE